MTGPTPPSLDEQVASASTFRDMVGLVWRGLGWRCRVRRRHDVQHVGGYLFRCTGCMEEWEVKFGTGRPVPTPAQVAAMINTPKRRRRKA